MTFWASHEKRLTLRRAWRTKVVLEDEYGEGLVYLYSKDISLGGLLLEEAPPLKLGSQLFLSFCLPGKKRPIRITGQIVRFIEHSVNGTATVKREAGIRFVDLDPRTFELLSAFVRG